MTNYKLLPEEPTDEMIESVRNSIKNNYTTRTLLLDLYAAAPQVECEPVAYMDAGNTCAITVFTIGKLQERGNIGSNFPYELWPTKLYTIPPDAQAKISELEAKLKFSDDLKLGELKRINVQLHGKVEELEADKAQMLRAIEHAEYMAKSAEALLKHLNDISNIEECVIEPDDNFADFTGAVKSCVYEFRKRAEMKKGE